MKKSLHHVLGLAFALAASLTATAALAHPVQVREVEFPVVLSDGNTYSIAGHFYQRPGHARRALQVLVHGATYDHRYWDAPDIDGHDYSYARHMAEEGYAVLAIDQLGTGASDHPDGDFLTIGDAAAGLHQVMAALRGPHNPTHRRFQTIVLVGHSLGSVAAVAAEAAYGDADGLVVTGLALTPHPPPVDPAMLGGLLQSPYVSFPAAVRAQLFYHAPAADPAVIAYDNAVLSSQVPRAEFVTGLQLSADAAQLGSDLVTEPILVQLGEYDVTAPASLAPTEAAYYPMASSVTVKTVPSGHAFNLHQNNAQGWRQIEKWIEKEICDD